MFCKLKISSTSKNNQILKNYLISFEVCDPQVRNPRSSLHYPIYLTLFNHSARCTLQTKPAEKLPTIFQSCAAWARRKKRIHENFPSTERFDMERCAWFWAGRSSWRVRRAEAMTAFLGGLSGTRLPALSYLFPPTSPYRYPLHLSLPPLRGAHFPPPRSNRPPLDTLSR